MGKKSDHQQAVVNYQRRKNLSRQAEKAALNYQIFFCVVISVLVTLPLFHFAQKSGEEFSNYRKDGSEVNGNSFNYLLLIMVLSLIILPYMVIVSGINKTKSFLDQSIFWRNLKQLLTNEDDEKINIEELENGIMELHDHSKKFLYYFELVLINGFICAFAATRQPYLICVMTANIILKKAMENSKTEVLLDADITLDVDLKKIKDQLNAITFLSWEVSDNNYCYLKIKNIPENEIDLLKVVLKKIGFYLFSTGKFLVVFGSRYLDRQELKNTKDFYRDKLSEFAEKKQHTETIVKFFKDIDKHTSWEISYYFFNENYEFHIFVNMPDSKKLSLIAEEIKKHCGDSVAQVQHSTISLKVPSREIKNLEILVANIQNALQKMAEIDQKIYKADRGTNTNKAIISNNTIKKKKQKPEKTDNSEQENKKTKTRSITPNLLGMVKGLLFNEKGTPSLKWQLHTHHGMKIITFDSVIKYFDAVLDNPNLPRYLFTKKENNAKYYGILDLTDVPREYWKQAQTAFDKGYGQGGISETNLEVDGCCFKIRFSDEVRLKPYAGELIDQTGQKHVLLYFSVWDNKPHDLARSVVPKF